MKCFAVRIQEGARPHLRVVQAESPDSAAVLVIRQIDDGDRLLGAKIAVWEHGSLHKNASPLFIKSIHPFETTPEIQVALAIREESRRAKWLELKARAEELKVREMHEFERPFERWIGEFEQAGGGAGFFGLSPGLRRDCFELRDRLKHVTPGQMTEVQARFAGIVAGFSDLHRFEMHSLHEHLAETLEVIHHRLAGIGESAPRRRDESPSMEKLASLIGITVAKNPNEPYPTAG